MTREFNYEAAKNGAPVQTRDGRQGLSAGIRKEDNIVALIDNNDDWGEMCVAYTDKGRSYVNDKESPTDLVMVPTKHEGWVNVYSDNMRKGKRFLDIDIRSSKEASEAIGKACAGYITTIKIEWTE